MKKHLLTILFITTFAVSFSQSLKKKGVFEVKGTVKTDRTLEAISGVRVYIVGGNITETDFFGAFKLKAKVGDDIYFESPDFETVHYTIVNNEDVSVLVKGLGGTSKMKRILSKKNASSQHNIFLDSANFYKKKDIDKSITFIEKSLSTLSNMNDRGRRGKSFNILGDIYLYYQQYDLAISNYKNSLKQNSLNSTKKNLGKAYLLNGEYQKAKLIYEKLAKNNLLSSYDKISVLEGLGDVYKALNETSEAIESYNKGLKLSQDNLVTPKITDLNSKIAEIYSSEKNIPKAKEFYGNSLDLAKQENSNRAVQEKEKVADFYSENQQYDEEIELRQSTLEDVEAMEQVASVPMQRSQSFLAPDSITSQKINYKIANAYIAQDKFDEAIPYLEKSIAEADDKEDLVVQKDATRKLSEVYRYAGDYTKALESYQKYVQLVDKLYVKKEQEISQVSRFSRDINLKQNRISSLEKDRELSESKFALTIKGQELISESNKRQKLIIYALVFAMGMMMLITYLFYRNNKQQRLANNLLALKSLRSQMNPHFIFNALNSVNNFIAKSDERSANRYLTEFSTLMRAVLENSEEDFIPLSKEIELLQLYTKLEHSRFTDKFEYEINIDENVSVDDFQIPPMLVQPYIENAIWHGLRYKEEKGYLKIELTQTGTETIKITIEDNGVGRKKSRELKTSNQKKQKSKGMGNIKNRIDILNDMYKDKVDVFIEDAFDDETGTRVVLTLKKN